MILYKDGTRQIVNPKAASRIWLCINGYTKPKNTAQALYIARVAKLYLGPRTKHLLTEEQKKRQLTMFDKPVMSH